MVSAFQEECTEFDRFLQSRLLTRSPSLHRLASFIGRQYFAGQAAALNEYTIAVDALGRSSDFDPKLNSIVRVELYRLRKKLDEYYRTEGKDSSLRILLDPGQYALRFQPAGTVVPAPDVAVGESRQSPLAQLPPCAEDAPCARPAASVAWRRHPWPVLAAAAGLLCLIAAAFALRSQPAAPTPPFALRFIPGGNAVFYFSESGWTWNRDPGAVGGQELAARNQQFRGPDVPLHAQRFGDFDYQLPVPPGVYELRLYFGPRLLDAEHLHPLQSRRFSVSLNGRRLIDPLDPANASNQPRWRTRVFRDVQPAADGLLHLRFRSAADPAYLSALELTAGERGHLLPLRIPARTSPVLDRQGHPWPAERYVSGGTLVSRTELVPPGLDPNLFASERFGNFAYAIPLARGRYRLRLYFAETWFTPHAGGGGPGSRRFDVFANGVPLLQDFDIFRQAGGPLRPLVRDFYPLEPDLEGYLNVSFVPRVNNACVNALEVIDETP